MDDVKKFAKAFNQPTLKATPRSNSVVGFFADALKPVQQFASNYNIPQSVPLIGGQSVADITGLTGAQGLLEDVSYGAPVVRGGSFQTAQIDPRVLDVAGLVPTVGGVLKGGGMYGKSLAKEVGRNINEGTTIGQMLDPRMNMIAYHGSPHSFDKFSMDKIGTGEGAQAYGHGLYFADDKDIAEYYQKKLSEDLPDIVKLDEHEIMGKRVWAANVTNKKGKNYNAGYLTEDELTKLIGETNAKDVIDKSNRGIYADNLKLKINDNQNLYKVDISDDAIPNMLLWDKPLSEQPEAVKQALQNLKLYNANNEQSLLDISNKTLDLVNRGKGGTPEWSNLHAMRRKLQGNGLSPDASGADVYKALTELKKGADNKASNALLKQGIQGIRYLDAGSRGKGAGTMNTVVFDDSLVKILEKNGKPVGVK